MEKELFFYELPFGPAHCGSGNFHVKIVMNGEKIVEAKSDPGYLHRGFEKLMEYRTPLQNAVLSDRICVLEPLSWNLVHAEAVDKIMGYDVPERAKYIRVIMAELTRIQSHLIWFGATSLAMGFDTGFKVAIGYRDYILDLFEMVTGGRVYPAGYIRPGGVRWDFPNGFENKCYEVLEKIERCMVDIDKILFKSHTFKLRTKDIGRLDKEDVLKLGATGPVARASGVEMDVRKDEPYEIYDRLEFDVPVKDEGDAYARLMVGREEIDQSINIIKQALKEMPEGEISAKITPFGKMKEGEAYAKTEAARGEAGIYMVSNGQATPYRVKIRGPSFLHLIPVLEHLLIGSQIADVPLIYWSLNHCPADMDR